MKSFTAGPLVVKQTFSKSIQLNSIGWPHRDKTLLGIREPLVIPAIYVFFFLKSLQCRSFKPFQPEVLGCDKLTPVPLSMQTPMEYNVEYLLFIDRLQMHNHQIGTLFFSILPLPKHFPSFLSAQGLDIDSALLGVTSMSTSLFFARLLQIPRFGYQLQCVESSPVHI